MGFWQSLVKSYEMNADALKLRYPLSTTTISNNSDQIVVITIKGNGEFVKADKIDKAKRNKSGEGIIPSIQICIPVTEKSMGCTSGIAPHPVFGKYEYLMGSGKKFDEYLLLLKRFSEFEGATPQVRAIYQYMNGRSVQKDLETIAPGNKTIIVFEVTIPGNPQIKVWEDQSFFDAWHAFYLKEKEIEQTLDYITGNKQPPALSHPKKIVNSSNSANAKLISDNDDKNFTFRGKFKDSSEAISIGYETSQKAHQFLRFLIKERGIPCGEQIILSFTIGSTNEILSPPIEEKNVWDFLQEGCIRTETDSQIDLQAETGLDYANELRKSIAGYGYNKTLDHHARTAVVVLDAATTGRLSITFYRELERTEYLEKIADWHETCKWSRTFWSQGEQKYLPYLGAPSVDKVIEAIYGKPRAHNDQNYIKIKKAARERLLRCVFDGANLPRDYVVSAIQKVSNPLGVTKDGKFDRNGFDDILSTACSLVRKERAQYKEDCRMSIELERTDRDYLYGRLLGAADKLEEYALHKKDKNRTTTSAIRHMQAFAQRPFRTWQTIHTCLNPYIQVVKHSYAFKEIEAIQERFSTIEDYRKDAPLGGLYLIGYYHERAYINSLVSKHEGKEDVTSQNQKENDND